MWGPGPCGPALWGFWWIFPLIGALICLALLVVAFRFIMTGRGPMCMSGHAATDGGEVARMRGEIDALRAEVGQRAKG